MDYANLTSDNYRTGTVPVLEYCQYSTIVTVLCFIYYIYDKLLGLHCFYTFATIWRVTSSSRRFGILDAGSNSRMTKAAISEISTKLMYYIYRLYS
jgi:hypothetical protein